MRETWVWSAMRETWVWSLVAVHNEGDLGLVPGSGSVQNSFTYMYLLQVISPLKTRIYHKCDLLPKTTYRMYFYYNSILFITSFILFDGFLHF